MFGVRKISNIRHLLFGGILLLSQTQERIIIEMKNP
jgi:hypothetical protein